MIEPSFSLAVSIQASPGVYAILLGSGVSRSSGVPTGWEVVGELIRKLATLSSKECGNDPHGWYRAEFSREPIYSEILNELAKTPADRLQLLRVYFEPTDDERDAGRKLPTAAHKAIADLVAKKYIRVLITTNFDRLLESALADAGIQPFVVSTDEAAKGAMPLAHSRCTVIKINGDYLDTRLRNTADELEHYEPEMEELLDQVFDEYGLVVCGWSGESDTGLRAAIQRCKARRFTTYWTTRDKLSEKAQDVATLRQATIIPINSADQFLGDLRDKIFALEDVASTDVLSAKVAVARMKKYLADPAHRISLHDLITSEAEKVYALLNGPAFPLLVMKLSYADVAQRLKAYEAALETVLRLMICGAYWGEPQHDSVLLACYKRLADRQPVGSSTFVLGTSARYPALVLLYGAGIAAVANHNYRFLRVLFDLKVKYDGNKPEKSATAVISDQAVLKRDDQKRVLGGAYTPLSDHLFVVLRDPLREYLPSDAEYEQTFDWFEYLLCLCHCDAGVSRSDLQRRRDKDPDFTLWASVGRFAWKGRDEGEANIQAETEPIAGQPYPEKVAAVLRAGFFESGGQMQDDKFREVKAALDRLVEIVRREWGVFF